MSLRSIVSLCHACHHPAAVILVLTAMFNGWVGAPCEIQSETFRYPLHAPPAGSLYALWPSIAERYLYSPTRGPTEHALRSCEFHKVPENALRPGPLHLAAAGYIPLHVPAGRLALHALAFDY